MGNFLWLINLNAIKLTYQNNAPAKTDWQGRNISFWSVTLLKWNMCRHPLSDIVNKVFSQTFWKGKVRTDLFLSKLSSLRPNKNGYSVNSRPQPLRLLLSSTYRKLTIKNLFMIVFPILFSEKLRNIGLFYTTRNISSSISTVALHWLNI